MSTEELSELNGDELRNLNSWDYLKVFRPMVEKIASNSELLKKLDTRLESILKSLLDYIPQNGEYQPNNTYGDFYTKFLLTLEEHLPAAHAKCVSEYNPHNTRSRQNLYQLDRLVDVIYMNSNRALERTALVIKPIVTTTEQTSNAIQQDITTHLSKGSPARNITTPQLEGSPKYLFKAMLSRNYKPQMTTSMASVRTYAHSKSVKTTELRFGTQGQRSEGIERVSPLFSLWLDVQNRQHVARNFWTTPNGAKAISHVYINNLGLYRRICG